MEDLKEELTYAGIINQLKTQEELIVDFGNLKYDLSLIRRLQNELKRKIIIEYRPTKIIKIIDGIDSRKFKKHQVAFLEIVDKYVDLRNNVYSELYQKNTLSIEENDLADLVNKLKSTKAYPRGLFGNWSYWFHGIDIEFENKITKEHINVNFDNFDKLSPYSLLKYINSSLGDSNLSKFLMNKEENIEKIMYLEVLKGELIDVENECRMKIIIRNQAKR